MLTGADSLDLHRLGGTIKWGEVFAELDRVDYSQLADFLESVRPESGKLDFGVSCAGLQRLNLKTVLIGLKKELAARGVAARFVNKNFENLSSAQVEKQGLLARGVELLLVGSDSKILAAVTRQVQPYDSYRARDYEKSARDARVGMLPPKLAQILVNLAAGDQPNLKIYDPFCGTGTVLVEAALLGHAIAGSDISPEMVAAARQNLAAGSFAGEATEHDARRPLRIQADAVATEGYLGPRFSRAASPAEAEKISAELADLYSRCFAWLPMRRVAICFPAWLQPGRTPIFSGKVIIPAVEKLGWKKRGAWLYSRPDQFVGREVVVLEK